MHGVNRHCVKRELWKTSEYAPTRGSAISSAASAALELPARGAYSGVATCFLKLNLDEVSWLADTPGQLAHWGGRGGIATRAAS